MSARLGSLSYWMGEYSFWFSCALISGVHSFVTLKGGDLGVSVSGVVDPWVWDHVPSLGKAIME